MLNRPLLKRPKGITVEDGIEFAHAINEAKDLGLTMWHMIEEWNGRWHCRLADPNSNAPSMGDSISYGRTGDTPAEAIRNAIREYGARPDEREYEALIRELRETDPLGAPVVLKKATAERLIAALARWQSALYHAPLEAADHGADDDDL